MNRLTAPRLTIESKMRAHYAGYCAAVAGKPKEQVKGWGFKRGLYYQWFLMGYNRKPFNDFIDEYAEKTAYQMSAEIALRQGSTTIRAFHVMEAFARYIAERE